VYGRRRVPRRDLVRRGRRVALLPTLALAALATVAGAAANATGSHGPAQPSAVTVNGASETSITLSWAPSGNDTGMTYKLFRDEKDVGRTTATSYTFSGLGCGPTYKLGVSAVDASGNASQVATTLVPTTPCPESQAPTKPAGSGWDSVPPSPPTRLVKTASSGMSISVSWNTANDDVGVSGYRIAVNGSELGSTTQASYTVTSLTCGTSYTVSVVAFDAAGTSSAATSGVLATDACPSSASDTQPPTTPTNLGVATVTQTSVSLTWSPSSDDVGVDAYDAYRSGIRAGQTSLTSYQFTDLACGTSYTFDVDAYDAGRNTSTKATLTARTSPCAGSESPSPPSNLTVARRTQTSVTLTWSGSNDVEVAGYDVYLNGTNGGSTRGTSFTITGFACNTTHTLGVEAYNAAGNRSTRSTISATTLACPAPDYGATGYRRLDRPAFTPTRVLTATTPAQFSTYLANLQAGDELDVEPMTISGEVIIRNSLPSYAEIHFGPGVHFSGTEEGSALPAVWIVGARNIRLFGGDLSNPGGGAILVYDSSGVLWWDFKAHEAGGGCLSVFNVNSGSSDLDFDGELWECGLDLSYDPHAERGTGQHGAYIGGGDTGYTVSRSKFSLYVHDQPYGAAVQAGSNISGSEFWIKAVNVAFAAQRQVAGNAIQFWGGALNDITVHAVTGENLAGRVVETGGMYPCCNSNIVVEYGRGRNVLRNQPLSRVGFAADPAVVYRDVALLP
jgi:chitodextrinase